MLFLRQIILVPLFPFTFTTTIASVFDDARSTTNNLRHQAEYADEGWGYMVDEFSDGNETTVSPAPSVAPSSNTTTISPSPSVVPTPAPTPEPSKTVSPTTSPPTTAPPTTGPPTKAPAHHAHHKWWQNLFRFLLKTLFWMIVAGLFFFAFGAIMSNRYRIYFYLRGNWYSLLQKIKWSRRRGRDGSAPSSTLNDIIFSENNMQEGLLMRET